MRNRRNIVILIAAWVSWLWVEIKVAAGAEMPTLPTDPAVEISVLVFIILAGGWSFWRSAKPTERPVTAHKPRLAARNIALWIDYIISTALALAILSLVRRMIELVFGVDLGLGENETETALAGTLELITVLFVFVFMILYFFRCPKYGRQTIGQWVMGYRIVDEIYEPGKPPQYGNRMFAGIITVSFWPLSLLWNFTGVPGRYWMDKGTNTQAYYVEGRA